MAFLAQNIKGDKFIWGVITLLAVFSFFPVFSAGSNFANLYGLNPVMLLFRHIMHLALGFVLMYFVHKTPSKYFKRLSVIGIPLVIGLLAFTLAQGTTIGGANASRWIRVPIVNISFQTSAFANVVLMVYIAYCLDRLNSNKITIKQSVFKIFVPTIVVLMLILPANFSTTAMSFVMVIMLIFVGGFPIKYIFGLLGVGLLFGLLFGLFVKAFPGAVPNRVETWISRIENFTKGVETKEDIQVLRAKMAIASGGITGLGPGKGQQKNLLPQSSSDFIYAIIIEEWGVLFGIVILASYLFLMYRMLVLAFNSKEMFSTLLVVGVGFPIIFQALVNMSVATSLGPVTGQTLPLISSGGSSIWMTCLGLGIVLSVSSEFEQEKKNKKLKNNN